MISETLTDWLGRALPAAVGGLLRSVSATSLHFDRPGKGRIVPLRGSVLASPVPGRYDPEPDYFFHWFRDAPLVIDALRLVPPSLLPEAAGRAYFADFVAFNERLAGLDGRQLGGPVEPVAPEIARHLRPQAELASVHGERVFGDVRVDVDGTLDRFNWARPQHDGPALRALCLLRWLERAAVDPRIAGRARELVRADLQYLVGHAEEPCFDVWEEESAGHFFTRCVALTALESGSAAFGASDPALAHAVASVAARLAGELERHVDPDSRVIQSRLPPSRLEVSRALDAAVLLAALQRADGSPWGPQDPRVHSTLWALARCFAELYPINHHAGSPALGRYAGDRYFGGNPWYVTTLAAAELCYRAGAGLDAAGRSRWHLHGDGFLATVRRWTPANLELAEQFDRESGAPRSARHLAWSYAALIRCAATRAAYLPG